MSGFNAAFVRIPANTFPDTFVKKLAREFFVADRRVRNECRVQYAHGYDWVHLSGFSNEGDSLSDTRVHPALRPLCAETISLTAHDGSSVYFYRHHLKEQCLRAICVAEGEVHQNYGNEEFWERQYREDVTTEHGNEVGDWPAMFHADYIIQAFRLPSPWKNMPPTDWDLDFRWDDRLPLV